MTKPLNFRQIELFTALIEQKTVSAAAAHLNISQPAASKLLRHLEIDTGLDLFERTKGRLWPTAEAMTLYEEVCFLHRGLNKVEDIVRAIRRRKNRELVIGVLPALSTGFIGRAAALYLERNANVLLNIISLPSIDIVRGIMNRTIDVGLIGAQGHEAGITSVPLMERPMVCIMPRDHPLAARTVIMPHHLADVPFISFNLESSTSRLVRDVFAQEDVTLNVAHVVNTATLLLSLVSAGLGVSIVHPFYIPPDEPNIVIREFSPNMQFMFRVCYLAERRPHSLTRRFADIVRLLD
ncbi:LysR family transcriptional regulator [Gluconacetobacter liquefaciens]|uniref:DNA-binding transcriptional LysR family regulator n=1 Tax=Gluconacetobacter liquefaciens TaxID=89584 RepID=A0A370G1S3_GLULI|nr:LysR substrate-binding domain-containing protein [Gluconacetobacter liquefaciens]MBB2187284.1 LysR family transcriptional regulator [Gluconacetobacter liquefaciens]RDI36829.1 DNA-binding transcriptional LysR family regulator [Gluconacetobacter liquefaciens]GBQ93873.1 transcriptional regulator [Gluconacetobacter liquefaciens NRIC 0522]GEB38846.1 LysR family transcriptional regulator [Gluconacetobacter liquefaciens]